MPVQAVGTRPVLRQRPAPNPPHSDVANEGTGRRWIRRITAIILAVLSLGGLTVSAGMLYGFDTVDARIAKLADSLGVDIAVRHVDLGLDRPTVAHRVFVDIPDGPQVAIQTVTADLDLAALAAGARRPTQTTLRGLRLKLEINRQGVVGLGPVLERWRARSRTKTDSPKKKAKPLSVGLEDAVVVVQLSDPKWPKLTIRLEDVSATVTKTGEAVSLTGEGTFEWAGQRRQGRLALQAVGKELVRAEASLDAPLTLPLTLAGRRYLVTAKQVALDRTNGQTTIEGIAVADGLHSVKAERIVINDTTDPGMLPQLNNLASVAVISGILQRGAEVASTETLALELSWPDKGKWPTIKRLAVEQARVEVPGKGILASAEKAALGFDRPLDPTAVKTLEDVADALKFVKLDTPTATVTAREGQWASLLPKRLRRFLPSQPAQTGAAAARVRPPQDRGKLHADPKARMQRLIRLLRRLPIAIEDGLVSFKEHGVGPVLTLDNFGLRLKPGDDNTLTVDVDAMVVRDGKPTGQIKLTTTVDESGQPREAKGVLAGQDFAHLASRFSKYVAVPPTADLEVAFAWTPPNANDPTHKLSGKAKLKNFGFEAWRIAHVPIAGIKGEVDYKLSYDPGRKHLAVEMPSIILGKAKMHATLALTAPQKDKLAKISVRVGMLKQDCADVRNSIPAALLPRLAGLKMRGNMWFEAALDVDMDQPKQLTLDVKGSMEACQVLTLGEIDLNELKGKFVHYPVEPKKGVRKDIPVGRGTKSWVPHRKLPRLVRAAAIVTEDRSYWKHGGVRWALVRRALKLNLSRGRFVYGGSTITQQLVKNLYLTREKALSRKLEEAIIAMHMERVLTKDEILEIYVNIVEFGPDIYGVKRASRFYFGKRPRHLSPVEAAFIMGLKPWPRGGYKQWSNGRVNAYWVKRLEHILNNMNRIERAISVDQIEEARPFQPQFRPRGASHSWGTPYRRPE